MSESVTIPELEMLEIVPNPAGFVTRMTAEGPGAIGVLRIWGDRAVEVADSLFRPRKGRKRLADSAPGELRLGWFGGDEVVALLVDDSATGRREVEIQGHGSEMLIDSLIGQLASHGINRASRADFLEAHGMGRLQRLALEHLGRAMTTKSAIVLHRQARGAMRTALEAVLADLGRADVARAIARIEELLNTATFGTRLASGFRVALAGPPNVGKSTLINALTGFERTVVSPTPGTTRDAVDVPIVLDGWPIVLTDTAGLRETTADPLEAEGIRIARDEHRRADIILRLKECGHRPIELVSVERVIDVSTKADLASGADVAKESSGTVVLSARTGEGLDRLVAKLVDTLAPAEIAGADAVVFDEAMASSLEQVRTDLRTGSVESAEKGLRAWVDG